MISQIAQDYVDGEEVSSIARKNRISEHSVWNHLNRFEIPRHRKMSGRPRRFLSERELGKAIKWYASGKSITKIAAQLSAPHGLIYVSLKRSGAKIRPQYIERRRFRCNHNSFSEITPESAYWCGMLVTDGYITYRNEVCLSLAVRDRGAVLSFRRFLQSNHPIAIMKGRKRFGPDGRRMRGGKMARIAIRSRDMASDLKRLGITPRKTFTCKAHRTLCGDRDFWRGAIDGDGWLMIHGKWKRPRIGLCGASRAFLAQFAHYASRITGKNIKPRTETGRKGPYYIVTLDGLAAIAVVRNLYCNNTTALHRKNKTAQRIITKSLRDPIWCQRGPWQIGSWSANGKQRKFSDDGERKIVADYLSGTMTLIEVSKKYGFNKNSIYRILRRTGTTRRMNPAISSGKNGVCAKAA